MKCDDIGCIAMYPNSHVSAGLQNNVKGHREKLMPGPQIPALNSHVWLSPFLSHSVLSPLFLSSLSLQT